MKLSELRADNTLFLANKQTAGTGQGTLDHAEEDQFISTVFSWDPHSIGSNLHLSRDFLEVSAFTLPEGKVQCATSSKGFEKGINTWEMMIGEENPGDILVGVCKSKIINNSECFSNSTMGYGVNSVGITKNGSNEKSKEGLNSAGRGIFLPKARDSPNPRHVQRTAAVVY